MPSTLLPGLVVVTLGVVAAGGVSAAVDGLSPLTAAVLVGAVLTNVGALPRAARPGARFAGKTLLRLGVVLLGFRLAVGDVAALGGATLLVVVAVVVATFAGTRLIGRALGVSPALSLLVATGFSICGASAIAAMQGVARAEEEEVAFAIGLVTLCGSLAIAVLPLLSAPLGLDAAAFGRWAGASVHDVGQVVATAGVVGPRALEAAIVVKLSRVVLLGPLVVGVGLARRRAAATADADAVARPPLVPLFVLAFLAAVGLRSSGAVPAAALDGLRLAESVVLTAALVGLGTDVRIAKLRAIGGRPLALGLASWLLVAVAAYAGVRATIR
jgi:uncharacterized integral membrane protein (TIGR00698 family)